MDTSILATKLYIPPSRPKAVSRPHLVEKMMAVLERNGSFVLLSGPAGFGKTSLLGAFVERVQQPVAWVSLEDSDNDPNRFWTYVIAACQSVFPGFGEMALELLRLPQPMQVDVVPQILMNELASLDRDLVLILDDYHTIQNEAVHRAFGYAVEHLPKNLHVIVSTRTDPPWPLARFRARNQLIEIRAHDLRFRTDEAEQFLNGTMGLALPAEDVAALETRTEGWIAGLQLAALSIQGRGELGDFVKTFTGSHVYVAEYLIEEILQRQPQEVQAFLLQTSILDRLTGGLCEAVRGSGDGRAMLEALFHANLFITALDDEGRWYRYHTLFGDLLRARLRRSLPREEIAALHRRAANWYAAAGMTAEAVRHALAAQDYPLAVRLVEAAALPMILEAHFQTVQDWLRAIPPEYLEEAPQVNLALAWMHLMRRNAAEAAPYVERLQRTFSSMEAVAAHPALQGEWFALQAMLLNGQGKALEAAAIAEKALTLLPETATKVRTMTYMGLAEAYLQAFQYERAEAACRKIMEQSRRGRDLASEMFGISYLGLLILQQGRLRECFALAAGALEQLERSGAFSPFSATLYGEVAEILYEWHQIEPARANYERSMALSALGGFIDAEIYYSVFCSRLRQMEGNLPAAEQEIQKSLDRLQDAAPALDTEEVIAQQVSVSLALGRIAAAQAALAPYGFAFSGGFSAPPVAPDSHLPHVAGILYIAALRVLLALSRAGGSRETVITAQALAEQVIESARRSRQLPIVLKARLLKSQMHAETGEAAQCMAEAGAAIALAEPEGFLSTFVEEGPPVAEILSALLERGGLPERQRAYIRQILAIFPSPAPGGNATNGPRMPVMPPGNSRSAVVDALVEPLTQREMDVLRRMAAGASNQSIADQLVITVSAVKKHAGNIYGKLNVSSRTQALARARQLKLLDEGE